MMKKEEKGEKQKEEKEKEEEKKHKYSYVIKTTQENKHVYMNIHINCQYYY